MLCASLLIAGFALVERPLESLLAFGTVGCGAPLYWFWGRRRAVSQPAAEPEERLE